MWHWLTPNVVLSFLICATAALYQELGERGNEMENAEYQRKKIDDLHKRFADAYASIHHTALVSFPYV